MQCDNFLMCAVSLYRVKERIKLANELVTACIAV